MQKTLSDFSRSVVVININGIRTEEFLRKHKLPDYVKIIDDIDQEIAHGHQVASTPFVSIIDREGDLIFRGNYTNEKGFCGPFDIKSSAPSLALAFIAKHDVPPLFPTSQLETFWMYHHKKLATDATRDTFLQKQTAQADKIVTYMILCLWGFGALISFHYDTWTLGLGMGSILLAFFLVAVKAFPKKPISRMIGASVMAFYMVQYLAQLQGLHEMHFWFFIMPMFLITYQDWRVFIPFAAIIVVHHVLIFILVRQGQEA